MNFEVGQVWRDVYDRGDYLIKEIQSRRVTVDWIWQSETNVVKLDSNFSFFSMREDTFLYNASELIMALI